MNRMLFIVEQGCASTLTLGAVGIYIEFNGRPDSRRGR